MNDSRPNESSALGSALDYQMWVGREETTSDTIDLRIARLMAATFDLDPQAFELGSTLEPLWHWAYFVPQARTCELGNDGHPKRGGFLPPVQLPNRMWAGGRVSFVKPLRVGEQARKVSRIIRCEQKQGRSGPLVFVTVQHSIEGQEGLCVREEQDLVYRNPSAAGVSKIKPNSPLQKADFSVAADANSVRLFRYSALTFNSHRIHYDHPFVTQTEGYPALVVQGALLATMLVAAFHQHHPDKRIADFSYRAVAPLFAGEAFELCGSWRKDGDNDSKGSNVVVDLWVQSSGRETMRAQASL